jgi:hypothetical protein
MPLCAASARLTKTAGVTGPWTANLSRSPPHAYPTHPTHPSWKLLQHPPTGAVRAARLPAAVAPATTRPELSGQMLRRRPAAKWALAEVASPRRKPTSSIATSTAMCTPRTKTAPGSGFSGETRQSPANKRSSNPSIRSSSECHWRSRQWSVPRLRW